MHYYVYILSNSTNTVIYTGVTNNLLRRVYQHKNKMDPKSFSAKYNVHKLVFFEETSDAYSAISREKQIKGWNRKRKNELINKQNPQWVDLYDSILGE
ncbi:MAG: GIY-YIG nuclease family protein [Oscillospiraceae bacterium]|nr:GIY-YIG nuclease family protein [Oscillospiraceae bacterium]